VVKTVIARSARSTGLLVSGAVTASLAVPGLFAAALIAVAFAVISRRDA
jgi:hypothetical protein